MNNSLKNNLIVCIIASACSMCIHSIICLSTYLISLLWHNEGLSDKKEITDENDYVRQYLDCYIKRDKPGFAVFINGAWGSGKTFFIKHYKYKEKKQCYVSLFGITNKNEFEHRLWKGLLFEHPYIVLTRFLFLLCISLIGTICFLCFANTVNIWLNTNYQIQWNACLVFFKSVFTSPILTSTIGSLSIVTALVIFVWKFTRFKAMELLLRSRFLVLDDFERVETSCDEVLSWINEFVEHINCPVLIIGNEEAIFNNLKLKHSDSAYDENEHYKRIKKKTIGKEFSFSQTDEKVCRKLISSLNPSSALRKTLENNIEWFISAILEPLKKEPYKHQTNYRVLALCFAEFDYYFNEKSIDSLNDWNAFVADEKIWKELIERFLSFMYLKKIRIITITKNDDMPSPSNGKRPNNQDIKYTDSFADNILKCDLISGDEAEKRFREFYPVWNDYSSFLPVSLWEEIKDSRSLSREVFSAFVKRQVHPVVTLTSRWQQMYYLDDKEFKKLIEDTKNEFCNPTVQSIEELIVLLQFLCIAFEKGNIIWNSSNLKEELNKYVGTILSNEKVKNSLQDDSQYYEQKHLVGDKSTTDNSSNSLFNIIRQQILDNMKVIHNEVSAQLFESLIETIKINPSTFEDWFYMKHRNYKDLYSNQNPQTLWDVLKVLSTHDFRVILECLRGHIVNMSNGIMQDSEISFWEDFLRLLEEGKANWVNNSINIWKCDDITTFCNEVKKTTEDYKPLVSSKNQN